MSATGTVTTATGPLAATGIITTATGPLSTTGTISTATGPLSATGTVTTATGSLSTTGTVTTATGPLSTTGTITTATGPLSTTGNTATCTVSLSTTGSTSKVAGPPTTSGAKYPRMCKAVVDLGSDIMRGALFHHITPAVILHEVHSTPYFSKPKSLSAQQLSTLSNAVSKGDYSECDITLLYSVLRNCTKTNKAVRPTKNWGIVPVQPGDTNLGDDLERIRTIRNAIYGHVPSTCISDSDYISYMNELKDICSRMDTVHSSYLTSATPPSSTYSQRLQGIQTCCMDPDTEAMYITELKRLADEEKTMTERLEHLSETQDNLQDDLLKMHDDLSKKQEDISRKHEDMSQKQEHLSEKLDDLSGRVCPLLL